MTGDDECSHWFAGGMLLVDDLAGCIACQVIGRAYFTSVTGSTPAFFSTAAKSS